MHPTERGPVSQAVQAVSLAAMVAVATLPASCGGDRQAGPAPVPAPFRPQTVEIALCQSGSTLMLMTGQRGRFTRGREEFRGGRVQARNGNCYELTLVDGGWLATFVPPAAGRRSPRPNRHCADPAEARGPELAGS